MKICKFSHIVNKVEPWLAFKKKLFIILEGTGNSLIKNNKADINIRLFSVANNPPSNLSITYGMLN